MASWPWGTQEACFQSFLGRLETDVVKPMQAYHETEVQVIRKKKKHFEAVDDSMDSAMVKYLSMKRDTAKEVLDQVSCTALSFCCASTVFLSKTVPFRAVCPAGPGREPADQEGRLV